MCSVNIGRDRKSSDGFECAQFSLMLLTFSLQCQHRCFCLSLYRSFFDSLFYIFALKISVSIFCCLSNTNNLFCLVVVVFSSFVLLSFSVSLSTKLIFSKHRLNGEWFVLRSAREGIWLFSRCCKFHIQKPCWNATKWNYSVKRTRKMKLFSCASNRFLQHSVTFYA